ncbi:MAG: ATP-binding protein [Candidatus Moranbacteria bacterium]|nr:ATP-binding protein [Candidatus Moranbacteria bacterium]
MSMLLNFRVKNYRSIKDSVVLDLQAELDDTRVEESVFEVGEYALLKSLAIFGPNASGKSNILRAFALFKKMIQECLLRSTTEDKLPSEPFKLNTQSKNEPSEFEMTILIDGEVFKYGFAFDKEKICSEWLRRERGNVTLFLRTEQNIESNKLHFREATAALKKQTLERVLFLSVLASNNATLASKLVDSVKRMNYILGTERGNTLDYSFGQFATNEGRAEKMKSLVVQADFGVRDIVIKERMITPKQLRDVPDKFKKLLFEEKSQIAQREIKFIHDVCDKDGVCIGSEALDFFGEESEGTQQFFALSAPIIDTLENGKVLFIDEIDSSLHPLLCRYLVSLFNSKEKNPNNAQFIFSTHDISLMNEKYLRRDQIFFADKSKDGSTELFPLSDLSERKGVNFEKRYMEGRYDALPYIKEYENQKMREEI